jgi:hypothetical protein
MNSTPAASRLHIGRRAGGAELILAPTAFLVTERKGPANDILGSGRVLQAAAHRGQLDLVAV